MHNWVEIYQSPKQRDPATIEAFFNQLTQIGVLPKLSNLIRFLRLCTIFLIGRTLKQLKFYEQQAMGTGYNLPSSRICAYIELDAYARLITIIINQVGESCSEFPNLKVTDVLVFDLCLF